MRNNAKIARNGRKVKPKSNRSTMKLRNLSRCHIIKKHTVKNTQIKFTGDKNGEIKCLKNY